MDWAAPKALSSSFLSFCLLVPIKPSQVYVSLSNSTGKSCQWTKDKLLIELVSWILTSQNPTFLLKEEKKKRKSSQAHNFLPVVLSIWVDIFPKEYKLNIKDGGHRSFADRKRGWKGERGLCQNRHHRWENYVPVLVLQEKRLMKER